MPEIEPKKHDRRVKQLSFNIAVPRASKKETKTPESPAANLQFTVDREMIPWLFASLQTQPEVTLFEGEFAEPFTHLHYSAVAQQNQLLFGAMLGVDEDFKTRFPVGVGTVFDMAPLMRRYPDSRFLADNRTLLLSKDSQTKGIITRVDEDTIMIQAGGQGGPIELSESTPVNDLTIALDNFNVLLQRYVSTVWKASPETDKKKMDLALTLAPGRDEAAVSKYLSTYEVLAASYNKRPRDVDLEKGIGGYSRVKTAIKALVVDTTDPDVSRRFGTQPFSNKFLLLAGAEGTGKSLFPKALYWELRRKVGEDAALEWFRLPIAVILREYGVNAGSVVETILNHVKDNERTGVQTIVHLDELQALVPPYQPTPAQLTYSMHSTNPIVSAIDQFTREIRGHSRNVIVIGESRAPRDFLPESVQRSFSRTFSLDDVKPADLTDILRVQITTSRDYTRRKFPRRKPFADDVDQSLDRLAAGAVGLVGNDIKNAIINLTDGHKAAWKGRKYPQITAADIEAELASIRAGKGLHEFNKTFRGYRSNS